VKFFIDATKMSAAMAIRRQRLQQRLPQGSATQRCADIFLIRCADMPASGATLKESAISRGFCGDDALLMLIAR
jgi:hypothetical protein